MGRSLETTAYVACMTCLALAFAACDPGPITQTVVRFRASSSLEVPDETTIHIVAHRNGLRQHEPGEDLGTFAFERDTKLVVDAGENDGSRRFTLFAELIDGSGTRISWARIRAGFVQGEIREVRITFPARCRHPSDQAEQPPDYDPTFVCGSHDTCLVGPSGFGICASACYNPEAYTEELGDVPSEPVDCPERDNLPVERLETGWDYTCALSDDEAFCWGSIASESRDQIWRRPSRIMNPEGRTTLRPEDRIRDLRASVHVACALTVNGELRCGGNNQDGRPIALGMPVEGDRPCCTVVPEAPPARALDAHHFYSCIVAEDDGEVWCTGDEPGPQEHDGFTPFERDGETARGFRSLHGGPVMIAGYTDAGFAWLQAPPHVDTDAEVPPEERVVDIGSNNDGLCMTRDDGALLCWGRDVEGTTFTNQPAVLGMRWRRIALSENPITAASHRCAIELEGSLHCWGSADNGKLGGRFANARTYDSRFRVGNASDWIDVAAGQHHSCGVRQGGEVFCWGLNERFQLGVEEQPLGLVRVPIPGW